MEAGSSIKCQEREVKRDSVMQWRSIVICESWEIQKATSGKTFRQTVFVWIKRLQKYK